jgi:plasmid maintenance system antidote protein VapI
MRDDIRPSPGKIIYKYIESLEDGSKRNEHRRALMASLMINGHEFYGFLHDRRRYTDDEMRTVADHFGDAPAVWFAANHRWNLTIRYQEDCAHSWVYDNNIMTSNPPCQHRICTQCGFEETVRGTPITGRLTYDDIKKRFEL